MRARPPQFESRSRITIHGRSSLSPTRRGRNAPVRARPPQFESRFTNHDSRPFQPFANAPRSQRPRACAAPAVRITIHDSRFTIHGRSSLSPTRRGRNAPVRARPPQFESRFTIHDSRFTAVPAYRQRAADATPPCVRGPRSSNHDSRFTIHGSSSLSPTRRGRDAPVRARPPQFESRLTIHDSRQFLAHPPGPSITAQAVLFCLETPASASRKRAVRPAHTGHNQTSRLPSQRDAYRHTGLSHEPATAPGRSRFRARDREMCKESLTLPMPGRQESSSTSFLRTVPASGSPGSWSKDRCLSRCSAL